jgi:hypothetical protein
MEELEEKLKQSLEECERLKLEESAERLKIMLDSIEILKKYANHRLIKDEISYQQNRVKYSNAYFSGSEMYKGRSFIEFVNNKHLEEYAGKFVVGTIMHSLYN